MSAKAKKKPTTPPAPVLAIALTPLAAFAEPVALGAITAASGPPTVALTYCKVILAIRQLAREVVVLPLSQLVSLKDAFKLANDRLGSYELAAQDLAQRARARQLTIVAQVVDRIGSKRVFILRPEFWRWYKVVWVRPRPEDGRPEVSLGVNPMRNNPVRRAMGEWYWFVGRRRLERRYSVAPLRDDTSSKDKKSDSTERHGMPPSGRSRIRKAIQDFTLKRYGAEWTSVTTAAVRKAAGEDKEFKNLVHPLPNRTTFAYALGHKKARKKARKKD